MHTCTFLILSLVLLVGFTTHAASVPQPQLAQSEVLVRDKRDVTSVFSLEFILDPISTILALFGVNIDLVATLNEFLKSAVATVAQGTIFESLLYGFANAIVDGLLPCSTCADLA